MDTSKTTGASSKKSTENASTSLFYKLLDNKDNYDKKAFAFNRAKRKYEEAIANTEEQISDKMVTKSKAEAEFTKACRELDNSEAIKKQMQTITDCDAAIDALKEQVVFLKKQYKTFGLDLPFAKEETVSVTEASEK